MLAILAVLTALLLPVFFSARAKSRTTACAASLKQIGTAMALYVADYDGVYPPDDTMVMVNGHGHGISLSWYELLGPYAGHRVNLQEKPYPENIAFAPCPDSADLTRGDNDYRRGVGYAYNSNLAPPQEVVEDRSVSTGRHETVVRFPATLIVACDASAGTIGLNVLEEEKTETGQISGPLRHQGTGNYLFADGHVRCLLPGEITISGDMPGDSVHPGFGL